MINARTRARTLACTHARMSTHPHKRTRDTAASVATFLNACQRETRKTIDAKHQRAPFNSLCMCYMLDNKK